MRATVLPCVLTACGALAALPAQAVVNGQSDTFQGGSTVPAALSGSGLQVLGAVGELRLYHGPTPDFHGPPIAAMLGVDNVTAVPVPGAGWLMLAGLLAVAARRRRGRLKHRQPLPPSSR